MNQQSIKKVEAQLQGEGDRQVSILFPATAIALYRNFNFKSLRIERFFDDVSAVFNECGSHGTEVSMIQMLDEQVGIDLRPTAKSKSWNEICFLNNKINLGTKDTYNMKQLYMMRLEQIKWVAPAIIAAEFIALHNKYRFSRPMLAKLQASIEEVREEYSYNSKRLKKACYELTGIRMEGLKYERRIK